MKRGFWIVALVIVMGLLMCLTWCYGMMGDRFEDVLLSFFQTTNPSTQITTQAPVSQSTTIPATVPATTPAGTTVPETTESQQTTQPTEVTEPTQPPIKVTARQVVVADSRTGQILYRQTDGRSKVYPASITKLFTAYVALQFLDPQQQITAGDELKFVGAGSSKAYIRKGQAATVEQLVQGLILPSGNDAAYILATAAGRAIGGEELTPEAAVRVFVDQMNIQAADLGLNGTHFMNPDGYHMGGHYTSLEDLVIIAQVALDTPIIAECAGKASLRVELPDGTVRNWSNTNKMLSPKSKYYCEEICGLKTGHTTEAGYCLLSALRQEDGGFLIVGVFGCKDEYERFGDILKLAREFGAIE